MVSHYQELLNEIPRGSFYDADGHILPRLDEPYELPFATGDPNTVFGVWLDDTFQGTVTTDADGEAIVTVDLPSGRHTLTLENDQTGRRFNAYVTIKDYATWLAAYAEALEGTPTFLGIDPAIDSTLAATRLAEADTRHIADTHGRLLRQPNDIGTVFIESYRAVLRRLRQAYRVFASRLAGLRQAVSAFTAALPLRLPREWRPTWILNSQFAPNHTLQQFSRVTTDPLAFINQESTTAVTTWFDDSLTTPGGPINDPPTPQRITVTFSPHELAPGAVAGTGDSLAGPAPGPTPPAGTVTLTDAGGSFTGADVGRYVILRSTDNVSNIGTFVITGNPSSTSIEFVNAAGVAESGSFSYWIDDAWAGGDITVTGTAVGGDSISETFSGTADGETLTSANVFATVASVTNDSAGSGAGDAAVGVADSKFLTIREFRGNDPVATPHDLTLGPGGLTWRSGDPVLVTANGQYIVTGPKTQPDFVSLLPAPATYDLSDGSGNPLNNRLWLDLGDRGLLAVALTTNLGAAFPANIITDINTEAGINANYGSDVAVLFNGTGIVDDAIQLTAANYPDVAGADKAIKVLPGPADASRAVFGLPRYRVDLSAPELAGSTVLDYTPTTDRLPDTDANYDVRVGRGLRFSGTSTEGAITAAGVIGIVTLTPSPGLTSFLATRDFGGYIRITGAAPGANLGLHPIVSVTSPTTALIRHETGDTFTTSGTTMHTWQLWIPGEIVTVTDNNRTAGTLTLAAPGLLHDTTASNPMVELVTEMPFERAGLASDGSVVVDIDTAYDPGPTETDRLTLRGTDVPDGWVVRNGTVAATNAAYFERSRLVITRGAADIEIEAPIPNVTPTYRGFPLSVNLWVQQHNVAAPGTQDFDIDVSWDGTVFSTLGTTAVAGTMLDATDTLAQLDPTLVRVTTTVPVTATTMVLRVAHDGTAPGERIGVERLAVTVDTRSSLYTGTNTVVRDLARTNLGEVIYVWSPEDLDPTSAVTASHEAELTATQSALGLVPDDDGAYPPEPGHIDLVLPVHQRIERFDISEYTGAGAPVNVLGANNDITWAAATLTNMTIVPGAPSRLTEVVPSRVSLVVGEQLAPDGGGVATLTEPSAHQGPYPQDPNGTARLYADGVPVPDTIGMATAIPWVFSAADEIDISTAEFNPSTTYTIDYDVLMQAETDTIDLEKGGVDRADYLWLVDCAVYRRTQNDQVTRTRTVELTFGADLRATLAVASNQDQTIATLTRDDGLTSDLVPEALWAFEDATTVTIESEAFDAGSIYALQYQTVDNLFVRQADFVVEARSATSAGAVPAAAYRTVGIDEVVDNTDRYHQLRVTFTGVTDTRDLRLGSLGLRGINAFGTPPNAPGLIIGS